MRSIVKIKHCNNFGYDNGKRFAFWAFEELSLGDLVVLDTRHGVSLGRVVEINLNPELVKDKPTREVISKVDFNAFDKRQKIKSEIREFEFQRELTLCAVGDEKIEAMLIEADEDYAKRLKRYNQLKSEIG